ncbi:DUF2637 domain-containing protein [Streptomyces sp. NPDC005963]|uniref:DUF2637 domain-containing protein n=1 Tax=Streptomyces sp. NPDC005963 TaxID=3156721 RepID=UPI0033C40C55
MYDPPDPYDGGYPQVGPDDWYRDGGRRAEEELTHPQDLYQPYLHDHDIGQPSLDWDDELTLLLRTTPAPPPPAPAVPRPRSHSRRKVREPRKPIVWPSGTRLLSAIIAMMTAFLMTAVGMLSALVSYDPLRYLALVGVPDELARGWPFLVFGPWLVACLSILRAAMHRRQALHAWLIVVCFTGVAMVLCIAHAAKTVPGVSVAAIPPVAALACFHQFIRQVTLTHPRHARVRSEAAHRARSAVEGMRRNRRTDA